MKTKQKTIGMLVEWILLHRKGDAFKNDTRESLAIGLEEDAQNGNLLFTLDEDIHFTGIVTFIPDREHSVLFVRNILVTNHGALKTFAREFLKLFPNYCIIGSRAKEDIRYNTPRLINHLLNLERN